MDTLQGEREREVQASSDLSAREALSADVVRLSAALDLASAQLLTQRAEAEAALRAERALGGEVLLPQPSNLRPQPSTLNPQP